ncbi:MAG TPA: hypothetical protein VFY23_06985 [Candidatus Limnocylindrales bacterium]|nr:hypothetical protein [Candidatus Limnocylindrales bacterium]
MRVVGSLLLALGLLVASLAAGFVPAMIVAVTINALWAASGGEEVVADVLRAGLVYLAWGVAATAVFVFSWRRLRPA